MAVPSRPTTTSKETHFAERCQLFIIIALGESIVVTGATASAAGLTSTVVLCLVVAFVETAALWWLYFGATAEHARVTLSTCDDPGRLARDAYTYFHLPIVAGIIATAVANELLIAAPHEAPDGVGVAMILGGPALYLLGESLFGRRMTGTTDAKRVAVAALLILLVPLGGQLSVLLLSLIVASLLLALAVWELCIYTPRLAQAEPRTARSDVSASAARSSLRLLTSSLRNTLCRWYSTVRGLMNSWAPISGLVCPSRASRATWTSWGVRASRVSGGDPAHGLAGGEQLAAGTLGERLGAHVAEALVGGAQVLARVRAPVLAPQPLAVHEPAARELDRRAAAREPLDRLAVERLVVAHAARGSALRPRAPIRCRSPACARSGARARRRPRPAGRCGRRPRSARPGPSRRP